MPRGRPPKPTAILKLQGTYHRSRHDRRGAELVAPGDLADCEPPEWMTERQRKLWADIAARAPLGVMCAIDVELFAAYVEVVDRHAEAVRAQRKLDRGKELLFLIKGPEGPVISPYLRIADRCVLLMVRLQTEMGFTPSARTRMSIAGKADTDNEPEGWGMLRRFPVIDGGRRDD